MKRIALLAIGMATLFSASAFADWGFWDASRSWIGLIVSNNTQQYDTNWYSLWDSGPGTFVGKNFGPFNLNRGHQLIIQAYDTKTWQAGGSQVWSSEYFYTVYSGARPASPTFTSMGGGWMADLGGGDKKWGNAAVNMDVLTNTGNNSYTLEIYGRIYGVEPIGEYKYDNNAGNTSNFYAFFQVVPEPGVLSGAIALVGLWLRRR